MAAGLAKMTSQQTCEATNAVFCGVNFGTALLFRFLFEAIIIIMRVPACRRVEGI